MTIHDEIDNYLAADSHGQLSDEERNALHAHLVECGSCRQAHRETKVMNEILEEKLTNEKPDVAFEQRMLAGFRNQAPGKTASLIGLIADLMRLRSTQIATVAAVVLVLVQVGRMITGEGGSLSNTRRYLADKRVATLGQAALSSSDYAGTLERSETRLATETDQVAASLELGRSKQVAASAPPPPRPEVQPEFHEEAGYLGKGASAKTAELADRLESKGAGHEASAEAERTIVTGSNIPTAEEVAPNLTRASNPALANRKLIRNATVELEIVSFDNAVQRITAFANEDGGYVATTNSEKQENGKLTGQITAKVLPENLDRFLQKVRGVGELKNQTLGTEDVTKAYFDTDARLKNARVMEQRLIDMLKVKTGKVSDLLQVEKELGRVREDIEKMQGELKYWDSQVQFATVTISLAEKDLEEPAAFLLKEHAQLALYSPEVEKVYDDVKALASPKVQVTNAQLNRDNTGRVSASISILIAPEESETVIGKVKAFGRVENFQVQTERIAQGGNGMSQNAKTKRDKVDLNITMSRDEQEQALQQTSLRIRTASVDEKTKALRDLAEKQSGRVLSSTFSRDPNGREFANVSLRVPMKNYPALMQSLNSLGKPEDVSVQRQERTGVQIDGANAPADISIQVYSQGNIVSQENGLFATIRRTLAQSASAITWSLRMIGVAVAFLAPWAIALSGVFWVVRRVTRARRKDQ